MATFYLRTRTGLASKGAGKNHVRYISGIGKHADKHEVKFVVDKFIPSFAKNAEDFFHQADKNERANGRSYRSIVIAIPREAEDKLAWAQALTDELLGDKHAYRLAIHLDDKGNNPHAHLMFSERGLTEGKTVKDFFSRLNPKEKKISGTAGMRWLAEVKEIYRAHILKVAPNYVQPMRGEQKIGQAREVKTDADQRHEDERKVRIEQVAKLRQITSGLEDCNAAIAKLEAEEAIKREAAEHVKNLTINFNFTRTSTLPKTAPSGTTPSEAKKFKI
jgi:MobA/MobL family